MASCPHANDTTDKSTNAAAKQGEFFLKIEKGFMAKLVFRISYLQFHSLVDFPQQANGKPRKHPDLHTGASAFTIDDFLVLLGEFGNDCEAGSINLRQSKFLKQKRPTAF